MRVILEAADEGEVAPTRVLLLPGAYSTPEDFVREGFASAVRERRLPVDLVFVELELQHLTDRTILRRLRQEMILPARALGCRSIWLGGISLGGFIALARALPTIASAFAGGIRDLQAGRDAPRVRTPTRHRCRRRGRIRFAGVYASLLPLPWAPDGPIVSLGTKLSRARYRG